MNTYGNVARASSTSRKKNGTAVAPSTSSRATGTKILVKKLLVFNVAGCVSEFINVLSGTFHTVLFAHDLLHEVSVGR